jgi:hypothetical protein
MTQLSDDSLSSAFELRRHSLIASLEKAILALGSDNIPEQIPHKEPERICDFMKAMLSDDREILIGELCAKVNAYETCFGLERARTIESIGRELFQCQDNVKRQSLMTRLGEVVGSGRVRVLPKQRGSGQSVQQCSDLITRFQSEVHDFVAQSKRKVREVIQSDFVALRRECDLLKRQNEEYEAAQKRFDEQEGRLEKAQATISRLTADLVATEAERDRVAQRFARLKHQSESFSPHSPSKIRVSDLQEQLAQKEALLKDKESRMLELREGSEAQRLAVDELTRVRERLSAKIEEMNGQLDIARTEAERVRTEKSELESCKAELLALRIEQERTVEALRQVKQKARSVSALAHQQETELSKELRDVQARIALVVGETSQYFHIESFDEIPRIAAEAKQQIDHASATLSRISSVLGTKTDDELMTSIVNHKTQTEIAQEFLRDTRVGSFKKCSKMISGLISQLDEARHLTQQRREVSGAESTMKASSAIGRTPDMTNLLKRLSRILMTDDPSEILKIVDGLMEVQSVLSSYVEPVTSHTLSQWITGVEDMRRREAHIIQSLGLASVDEIETSIDILMQHHREASEMQNAPGSARLSELIEIEEVCLELCRRLNIPDWPELLDTVTELLNANAAMNESEGEIMLALSIETPEAILPKIARISAESDLLQLIATTARTKNMQQLVQRIQTLIQLRADVKNALRMIESDDLCEGIAKVLEERNQAGEFINKILAALRLSDQDEILPFITRGMRNRTTPQSPNRGSPSGFLNEAFEGCFEGLLLELHRAMRRNEPLDSEGLDKIEQRIKRLQSDLHCSSRLFSKALSIISISEIRFSFPIDEACEARLSKLLDQAKTQLETDRTQRELVFNRAASCGYRGSDIGDAIDTIVAACCEAEREKIDEDVHAAKKKQKTKFRRLVANLHEKLSEEQQKSAELEQTLVKEQRTHQEIVLMASGQSYDKEFLNESLLPSELAVLEQAGQREARERWGSS